MYRMHRVFCATAWELEGERREFYDLISQFNESAAMARDILYVPVSLTNIRDKRPYQYTIEENIRDSRHYIVALGDDWGPVERNFRPDYRLALKCREDLQLPMEGVAVLVRTSPDGPPAFAQQLEDSGTSVTYFTDVPDFREKVTALLTQWVEIDALTATSTSA